MKKILFICNYRKGVGGISGQVELLRKHLKEEGYVADIFSTKGSIAQRFLMHVRLRKKAREYDVLHIHCCSDWGFFPAVLGISIGRQLRKRIVLTYHGGGAETFFAKHASCVKRWLLNTDANIALSEFIGKEFDKYGIPYTIIPNVIELNSSQYRERLVFLPHFICVRSHEPVYNIPCILRAFKSVQKQVPDATLTLVGDGSQHEELVKMVNDMELKHVYFTGRVDNSKIYSFLDEADVFLSSPLIDNMPVSVLEAMNAGLLVISSNVGGVPYMIEDGKTALLFGSNDDAALANKMHWVLSHQKESVQITHNAKEDVSKYSWEEVGIRIRLLYE